MLSALPPNQSQLSVTHRDKINRDIDARLACDDLKPVTAEDCKVSGMSKSEFVLLHNLQRDHLNSPLVRQLICDVKLTIEEALERSDPFMNMRWYNKHGVIGLLLTFPAFYKIYPYHQYELFIIASAITIICLCIGYFFAYSISSTG